MVVWVVTSRWNEETEINCICKTKEKAEQELINLRKTLGQSDLVDPKIEDWLVLGE